MRVFVTGATGFIGSAVVAELLAAGHSVLGLTRSEEGAAALTAAGAEVHRGSLDDIDSLTGGARAADGVIHTAFNHNFATYLANCEADIGIVKALGAGLARSGGPLLVTSGTGASKDGQKAADFSVHPRLKSEQAAAELAAQGVRASVIRLPPSVHGQGDHGFVPVIIAAAREKGVSAYVGDGQNRWPAVHRLDAARLFRLALEKGAPEAWYHGVADEGVAFRDIAETVGKHLGLPVVSLSNEESQAHFGFLAPFAAADLPNSSTVTRRALGWQPSQPDLLSDLAAAGYFKG